MGDFTCWQLSVNHLEYRGKCSTTSNNMKLVHWPLMGKLLHLVQWAVSPAQSPPHFTRCNSQPINGQCTNFILLDVWHYSCLYTLGTMRWGLGGATAFICCLSSQGWQRLRCEVNEDSEANEKTQLLNKHGSNFLGAWTACLLFTCSHKDLRDNFEAKHILHNHVPDCSIAVYYRI